MFGFFFGAYLFAHNAISPSLSVNDLSGRRCYLCTCQYIQNNAFFLVIKTTTGWYCFLNPLPNGWRDKMGYSSCTNLDCGIMENPTENRKIIERKSNKSRDTLWISTSDGRFYESLNTSKYSTTRRTCQQVPGANEDGRTTTRERQRGLDSYSDDIESETTTKMGAVQWRGLCIRGPGRKTKSLKWCGGEDEEEIKVFWFKATTMHSKASEHEWLGQSKIFSSCTC